MDTPTPKKRRPKRKAELQTAVQKLLDTKYVTDTSTQTGAEMIAAVLFQQATDPNSRFYGKALDTIVKLTQNEKERLEIEKLKAQIEMLKSTATDKDKFALDPLSQAIAAYVQASTLMDGGEEIAQIKEQAGGG